MDGLIRILLLLGVAGSAMTLLGSGLAYWRDEDRRMRRLLRRALGGAPPEMVVMARGCGVGLSLDAQQIAVLRNGGLRGLVYRLDQFMGAELIVNEQVSARAFRGEPRRPLDQALSGALRVDLRLIFDNPRDPDFELLLWPPADPTRRETGTALDAVQTGRRWISAAESLLRHPRAQVRIAHETASPPPEAEEDEGQD